MSTPLIFDINGFSLDDGPGIRTTVFLKGCPLSCVWCHNPESWAPAAEVMFYPGLCIGCGVCVSVCSESAAGLDLPGRIDRRSCTSCGTCAAVCPATALKTTGRYYPPDELTEVLLANRLFYETSGGGVTFSGGEPTLHMTYLSGVMRLLKAEGVNIALQTSGMFDLGRFVDEILPFVDIIHFDLKVMDHERHYAYTGVDNKLILSNFKWLAAKIHDRVIPRTPLVPGMTATEENLRDTYAFIRALGYEKLTLLPFNPGGTVKRKRLGIPLSGDFPETMMTREEEMRLVETFSDNIGSN